MERTEIEEEIGKKRSEIAKLEKQLDTQKDSKNWLEGNTLYWIIGIVAVLIVFNGFQLVKVASAIGGKNLQASGVNSATIATVSGTKINLDEYSTLAPALTSVLKTEPVLSGYKTRVTKFPTISEHQIPPKTGDQVQDTINALVPIGMPFYGQEAGVSFDDPLTAQNVWGSYEKAIQLNGELQQRYNGIINTFTCDYCCGSPQNPTIISRCGCGHARAWRGMAKWFLSKYGDKYNDAQIMGEMSRWKALWYPGPTIQRVVQEGAL